MSGHSSIVRASRTRHSFSYGNYPHSLFPLGIIPSSTSTRTHARVIAIRCKFTDTLLFREMSDRDRDGQLSVVEFCLVMALANFLVRSRQPSPSVINAMEADQLYQWLISTLGAQAGTTTQRAAPTPLALTPSVLNQPPLPTHAMHVTTPPQGPVIPQQQQAHMQQIQPAPQIPQMRPPVGAPNGSAMLAQGASANLWTPAQMRTIGGFMQQPLSQPIPQAPPPSLYQEAVTRASGQRWAITSQEKAKYAEIFNAWDTNKDTTLAKSLCVQLLATSGLPSNIVSHIFNLADIERKNRLSLDEFCVAMHLVYKKLAGVDLPMQLPPELVPPAKRVLDASVDTLKKQLLEQPAVQRYRQEQLGDDDDYLTRHRFPDLNTLDSGRALHSPDAYSSQLRSSRSDRDLAGSDGNIHRSRSNVSLVSSSSLGDDLDQADAYVSKNRRRGGSRMDKTDSGSERMSTVDFTDEATAERLTMRIEELRAEVDKRRTASGNKLANEFFASGTNGVFIDMIVDRYARLKALRVGVMNALDRIQYLPAASGRRLSKAERSAAMSRSKTLANDWIEAQLELFVVRDQKRYKYPAIAPSVWRKYLPGAKKEDSSPATGPAGAAGDVQSKAAQLLLERMAALTGSTSTLTPDQKDAEDRIKREAGRLKDEVYTAVGVTEDGTKTDGAAEFDAGKARKELSELWTQLFDGYFGECDDSIKEVWKQVESRAEEKIPMYEIKKPVRPALSPLRQTGKDSGDHDYRKENIPIPQNAREQASSPLGMPTLPSAARSVSESESPQAKAQDLITSRLQKIEEQMKSSAPSSTNSSSSSISKRASPIPKRPPPAPPSLSKKGPPPPPPSKAKRPSLGRSVVSPTGSNSAFGTSDSSSAASSPDTTGPRDFGRDRWTLQNQSGSTSKLSSKAPPPPPSKPTVPRSPASSQQSRSPSLLSADSSRRSSVKFAEPLRSSESPLPHVSSAASEAEPAAPASRPKLARPPPPPPASIGRPPRPPPSKSSPKPSPVRSPTSEATPEAKSTNPFSTLPASQIVSEPPPLAVPVAANAQESNAAPNPFGAPPRGRPLSLDWLGELSSVDAHGLAHRDSDRTPSPGSAAAVESIEPIGAGAPPPPAPPPPPVQIAGPAPEVSITSASPPAPPPATSTSAPPAPPPPPAPQAPAAGSGRGALLASIRSFKSEGGTLKSSPQASPSPQRKLPASVPSASNPPSAPPAPPPPAVSGEAPAMAPSDAPKLPTVGAGRGALLDSIRSFKQGTRGLKSVPDPDKERQKRLVQMDSGGSQAAASSSASSAPAAPAGGGILGAALAQAISKRAQAIGVDSDDDDDFEDSGPKPSTSKPVGNGSPFPKAPVESESDNDSWGAESPPHFNSTNPFAIKSGSSGAAATGTTDTSLATAAFGNAIDDSSAGATTSEHPFGNAFSEPFVASNSAPTEQIQAERDSTMESHHSADLQRDRAEKTAPIESIAPSEPEPSESNDAFSPKKSCVLRALYDFEPATEQELQMRADDILEELEKVDSNWTRVRSSDGKEGLVPIIYVEEVPDGE